MLMTNIIKILILIDPIIFNDNIIKFELETTISNLKF